ncbi:MAG: DNA-protecting protein DprA [Ignavibacteriae bacterium]|nr:DNA-protecting protein DprA [Ignavibacteria bacterium]MBI3364333.1 DNA-protecting protein DprA [Ignavibacteriota bacterium]
MISAFDLLVLSQVPGIGSNRLRALVTHFGSSSDVFHASVKEIIAVDGFSKKLASHVVHFKERSQFDEARRYAEKQLSRLNTIEGRMLTFWDKQYPEPLKKIYDPPPFLFVRGEYCEDDKYSIAIVGTRSPSEYGISMAERFGQEFVRLGITVVSGLARGIDTVAHSIAVRHGGRTVAVIGSGLDVIYPPENKSLYDCIAGQGAIISEYGMGAKPDAVNFPRRNRIISGVSLGTLIIETDINGGAMITANTALDQNREVFALPGAVTSKRSRGSHALIKDGRAKLVESIDDILDELSSKLRPLLKHSLKEEPQPVDISLFEKGIYDTLSDEPLHIDAIAERSGGTTADALVYLLSLEFKGLVKQLPGKLFVRR